MKCAEIINSLCGLCPIEYAVDWDNVGLIVGSYEKEVGKVYIAIDATDEIINDAVAKGSDMIITHHPLIFTGMKRVVDSNFLGRRVISLIKNDISYVAMHTNFDVSAMGDKAAKMIGLTDIEVLDVTSATGCLEDEAKKEDGIGKVGNLSGVMTLSELSNQVKEVFGLDYVKVFGNLEEKITRAAICPGSGKSVVDLAVAKKAGVLITGDIDHHTGIDANMKGINIIDAGHYGIEKIFIQVVKEYLNKQFPQIEVVSENIKNPFIYV